jgi:hypothetical protein
VLDFQANYDSLKYAEIALIIEIASRRKKVGENFHL